MSIKKTTLAVAVLASLAAVAAPASAATSVEVEAHNCETDLPITLTLSISAGKITVTPEDDIDITRHAPNATTDELEWVVKSRYRTARGARRDVVSRGDVRFANILSGPTTLDNRRGRWTPEALSGIRALDLGLTTDAHTEDEAAHPLVSADEEGCEPEAD